MYGRGQKPAGDPALPGPEDAYRYAEKEFADADKAVYIQGRAPPAER